MKVPIGLRVAAAGERVAGIMEGPGALGDTVDAGSCRWPTTARRPTATIATATVAASPPPAVIGRRGCTASRRTIGRAFDRDDTCANAARIRVLRRSPLIRSRPLAGGERD